MVSPMFESPLGLIFANVCRSLIAVTDCSITVAITAPAHKEKMRWVDIWAAAAAVDASRHHSVKINRKKMELY